jgi:two-component system, LytTR family, sensor kinase
VTERAKLFKGFIIFIPLLAVIKLQMTLLQKLISVKPGFWVYQITGFLLFGVIDLFNTRVDSWMRFLLWSIGFILAFILTFLFRPLVRNLYQRKPPFLALFFLLILLSIFFGVLWFSIKHIIYFISFPSITGSVSDFFKNVPFINILTNIYFNAVLFLGWGILYFGIRYRSDMLSESERYEKAQLYAREAQLKMLRYQINPHFLFNSLNSIQALIYENVPQADLMITELSEFLRFTLKYTNKTFVPVEMEVEIIRKYLTIEKIRFEDRLDYSIEMDQESKQKEVLCFLIQPFVENAIKHGLRTSHHLLKLNIRIHSEQSWLFFEIENSGKWIPPDNQSTTGIDNVRRRLDNAYPGKYKLDILTHDDWIRIHLQIQIEDDDLNKNIREQ